MPDLAFAIPGDLATISGGYAYDRRLIAAWRAEGIGVHHLRWGDGFPTPSAQERQHAHDSLAALAPGTPVLIDGLALGALPDIAAAHARRLRLTALVHHPLALETGLSAPAIAALTHSERHALASAHRVIATSAHTAHTLLTDYAVPASKLHVAPPGTDRPDWAHTPRPDVAAPRLLAIGAISPRKAYDVLLRALADLTDLPWTCHILGALDRAPATAAELSAMIAHLGLHPRVRLLGELPDTTAQMRAADIFVHTAHHEGYGMSVAEALAAGLPVIACAGGAIADLLADGAGRLVPAGDHHALARALRGALTNAGERTALAAAAARAGRCLPTWAHTAARVRDWVLSA